MALAGRPVSIGPSAYLILNFELSGPSHLPLFGACSLGGPDMTLRAFFAYGNYTASM